MEDAAPAQSPTLQKWYRIQDVTSLTGLSRPTIYRLMAAGKFPQSAQIGRAAVRWLESDLLAWQSSKQPKQSGV